MCTHMHTCIADAVSCKLQASCLAHHTGTHLFKLASVCDAIQAAIRVLLCSGCATLLFHNQHTHTHTHMQLQPPGGSALGGYGAGVPLGGVDSSSSSSGISNRFSPLTRRAGGGGEGSGGESEGAAAAAATAAGNLNFMQRYGLVERFGKNVSTMIQVRGLLGCAGVGVGGGDGDVLLHSVVARVLSRCSDRCLRYGPPAFRGLLLLLLFFFSQVSCWKEGGGSAASF